MNLTEKQQTIFMEKVEKEAQCRSHVIFENLQYLARAQGMDMRDLTQIMNASGMGVNGPSDPSHFLIGDIPSTLIDRVVEDFAKKMK